MLRLHPSPKLSPSALWAPPLPSCWSPQCAGHESITPATTVLRFPSWKVHSPFPCTVCKPDWRVPSVPLHPDPGPGRCRLTTRSHERFFPTPWDAGALTCHWIRTDEGVCGVTETELGGSPGTATRERRQGLGGSACAPRLLGPQLSPAPVRRQGRAQPPRAGESWPASIQPPSSLGMPCPHPPACVQETRNLILVGRSQLTSLTFPPRRTPKTDTRVWVSPRGAAHTRGGARGAPALPRSPWGPPLLQRGSISVLRYSGQSDSRTGQVIKPGHGALGFKHGRDCQGRRLASGGRRDACPGLGLGGGSALLPGGQGQFDPCPQPRPALWSACHAQLAFLTALPHLCSRWACAAPSQHRIGLLMAAPL